jgi:branched-chain amino acid transport system permease protein
VAWVNAIIQGVLTGGLYALFACGLSLMFGVMKVVNLAHGDLAVVAGYIAIGIIAVTHGLSVVIENGLLQFFTANSRGIGASLALVTGAFTIGSQISIAYLLLLIFAVAVAVLLGLQYFLSRSKYGRLIRAVADDKEAAQLAGADYRHVFGIAAAVAFATVALGGIAFGMYSDLDPTTGTDTILLFAFAAVVIGGLGSLWGTLLGGVVLGVAQQIGAQINISDELLAGYIVFLVVLVLRPQGLISRRVQS